ncbi:LysR substrate-binding domain-containing protein [Cognaticolwellia mytili]|uniref:LysR substrate-binding domain-containing protein n=1 Tax=Cognaticolwellia mytili TaxID=1888913 RepID=UPI001B80769D|nr:LysR substrate-binding domain-containing protein [Cognaticolwellia mytili]
MALKGNIFSGLVTFEVAARLGSFTKTADYLHITTGAISQQIGLLENQLSLTLFERHSRGIELTKDGKKLYQVVKHHFADIENVINDLQQGQSLDGEVKLKLTPSFAYKWLIPRLQKFYNLYPNISIQTYAEGALVDYQDRDFDLAIDYGQTPYVNPNAELLLSERFTPVMSPQYFKRFNWQDSSLENQNSIWQSVTLLHDAMPWRHAKRYTEWYYWFNQMKIKTESNQGHFFNRTDMSMAAAEAGLGVALARYALVENDFKSGRLISPFTPIEANTGYYIIQHRSSPVIECFKSWLLAEGCSIN